MLAFLPIADDSMMSRSWPCAPPAAAAGLVITQSIEQLITLGIFQFCPRLIVLHKKHIRLNYAVLLSPTDQSLVFIRQFFDQWLVYFCHRGIRQSDSWFIEVDIVDLYKYLFGDGFTKGKSQAAIKLLWKWQISNWRQEFWHISDDLSLDFAVWNIF